MADEAPPSFAESVATAESTGLPPGYTDATSRLRLTERVSTLETSKMKPWAFLKVNSRGGNPTSIPRFIQGEPITGSVQLSLEKTEHIEAVTIQVRGESLEVGQEPIRFLTTPETTLWSTSVGDPTGSPKLKGKYVWPFTLTLPDTVNVSLVEKGPLAEYPLPPSFSERASPSYLEYKIVVNFRRGRLRIDQTLSTSFSYHPRTRPSPASALRQLAYRENTPLLGPDIDSEGWEVFGPKSVIGTVFESRSVEIACLFSLAKPLCYTRGTSVPFLLTLSCNDRQALDLLSGRGSLSIQLVRTLRTGAHTTDVPKIARSDKNFVATVGKGIYWPLEDENTASETRKLIGEIAVSGDLKPSFVFPRISIKYHVTVAIIAPGFTVPSNDAGSSDPTFSHEIEIATVLPVGPIPRSRIPSRYQKEFQSTNYDVTIGILTGANQRFLHHHGQGFS